MDGSFPYNKNLFGLFTQSLMLSQEHLFVGMAIKDVSHIPSFDQYLEDPAVADMLPKLDIFSKGDSDISQLADAFEHAAKEANATYEIHHDFGLTAQELVRQSIFADLLVLNYRPFVNYATGEPDLSVLDQIIKGSKCPVLIFPESTRRIDNLIFTYDNKESSVFAIRAFSNLFSENLREKEVSILSVLPDEDEEIKNENLLIKLVKQHYTNIGIQMLEGINISMEISKFARSLKNPLVVMGAYGRSRISNLLLPSVAQHLLKRSDVPLFIAHR